MSHHVKQQGGQDQLLDVAECPGDVDKHDIAAGQGGEALLVAVLVQLADLVDREVHREGQQEHDQP